MSQARFMMADVSYMDGLPLVMNLHHNFLY